MPPTGPGPSLEPTTTPSHRAPASPLSQQTYVVPHQLLTSHEKPQIHQLKTASGLAAIHGLRIPFVDKFRDGTGNMVYQTVGSYMDRPYIHRIHSSTGRVHQLHTT